LFDQEVAIVGLICRASFGQNVLHKKMFFGSLQQKWLEQKRGQKTRQDKTR
jgi:hypothetical protein